MKLFGSLTAFKDLLSSFATTIGSAGTNGASTHSAAVTLQSGDAVGATSDSGDLTLKTGSATGTRGTLTLDSAALSLLCPTITMSATTGLTAATSLTLTSAAITLAGPITLPAAGSLTSATSMTLTAPTITLTASTKVSVGGAIEFTSANTRTSLAAPVSQAAAAATQTLDCATSSMFRFINHTSSCTVTIANMAEGQSITVLVDTVTAGAAIIWTGVKWSNQVVPIPTTTASRWDRYMFQKINGVIYGSASMNNY